MGTNKFIPLAYLSDSLGGKPIEIEHIQTSRQYLGLQFVKFFCMVNILCVYGLVHNWSRSENHGKGRNWDERRGIGWDEWFVIYFTFGVFNDSDQWHLSLAKLKLIYWLIDCKNKIWIKINNYNHKKNISNDNLN